MLICLFAYIDLLIGLLGYLIIMKIGIDISQIVYGTGVSRYTEELVKHLLKIDKKNHYLLFAGVWRQKRKIEKFLKEFKTNGYKFQPKVVFFPPKVADFIWNRVHIFQIERFTGPLDLFHSSNWAQPPASCPIVTTIHDLTPIKFPQAFEKEAIVSFKRNLHWAKRQAAFIIVDSKATEKDLIKEGFDKGKIKVVYLGVSKKFKQIKDKKEIEKIKKKYGIKGDYILSVGTLEPRKNIGRVIKSFSQLATRNSQLVLVGKQGWGNQSKSQISNLKSQITFTGFVPDNDLPALYSGAKVFVYPSLYEGFGLPVLESMACGCPVITSNISSLPEIAGNAALLINPKNTKEIKKAMEKLLTNEKLRKKLIRKGLTQAKKFSWNKTTHQTLEIYTKLSFPPLR